MSDEVRAAMGKAATEAAKAVGYVGAGTVEFIADGREGLRADRFYFMEMNTRLQVEHPVTEAITGLDLVELQLKVAPASRSVSRRPMSPRRAMPSRRRLYAEDPEKGFLPSTGKLWALQFPDGEGIRIDTGVEAGDDGDAVLRSDDRQGDRPWRDAR
jgi:3-methylcrotonyl-CoA carboxylase alpha subunit